VRHFLPPSVSAFYGLAAAQERWLREQIEIAVKEADDPSAEWIQHEVVRAERERAALLAESEHEQNSRILSGSSARADDRRRQAEHPKKRQAHTARA